MIYIILIKKVAISLIIIIVVKDNDSQYEMPQWWQCFE